jgi:hypothetical protein
MEIIPGFSRGRAIEANNGGMSKKPLPKPQSEILLILRWWQAMNAPL